MTRTERKLQALFKDPRGYQYAIVHLDHLIPDPENPRLSPQENVPDTILSLQRDNPKGLYNLAKDLVDLAGCNPAELLNVTPYGNNYLVKEGNRRLVALKILHNPELLRDHVESSEFARWKKLAARAEQLPKELLVVIGKGEDHDEWVARRHLGAQDGIGVAEWNPMAKARHEARRKGTEDWALKLLDTLRANYPERFAALMPKNRTFTNFTRVLDSPDARGHLGLDIDTNNNIVLKYGERSLRLLEEILKDVQRSDKKKLTSRRIPNIDAVKSYLYEVDKRVDDATDTSTLTLSGPDADSASSETKPVVAAKRSGARSKDVLNIFIKPTTPRLRRIFDELKKVKKGGAPNAAMILTRVMLELSLDEYGTKHDLPFANDQDATLKEEIVNFQKALHEKRIDINKKIRSVLNSGATRSPTLSDKLVMVVDYLVKTGKYSSKEGEAKKRELKEKTTVSLLHDAVHRIDIVPTIEKVDNILDTVRPIFNKMLEE